MNTLTPIALAVGLLASSVLAANAQDRDTSRNADRERGPAVGGKTDELQATGEVTRIDTQRKVVVVRADRIPGHAGKTLTIEYQVKDSSDLSDFKVGDRVKGELEQAGQAPPRFKKLEVVSDEEGGGGNQPENPNEKPGRVPGVGVDTNAAGQPTRPSGVRTDSAGGAAAGDSSSLPSTGNDSARTGSGSATPRY